MRGALVAAGAARLAAALLDRRPPAGRRVWARVNAAGEDVTLLEGPAFVAGATLALMVTPGLEPPARRAALVATAGCALCGAYDDLAGTADARGLRGHLGALTRGEVTTGAVKVLGIGAAGLLAGVLLRGATVDGLLTGGVVAGSANLANLFDLRPGRTIKVAVLTSLPLLPSPGTAGDLACVPVGAAFAVLPDDLAARTMLGDTGANVLGALVGLAVAARAGRPGLVVGLSTVTALTVVSERVSFTRVIESSPVLRELDRLGRRRR